MTAVETEITLLSRWRYDGFHSQTTPHKETSTFYKNEIAPDTLPALTAARHALGSEGYEFVVNPVVVSRCECVRNGDTAVTYSVWHTAHFVKDGARLYVNLRGGGESVEGAVAGTTSSVKTIVHDGEPVGGGRGQAKECRRIAERLYAEHGRHLGPGGLVSVAYLTRAGHGGWKEKTATRSFEPDELSKSATSMRPTDAAEAVT